MPLTETQFGWICFGLFIGTILWLVFIDWYQPTKIKVPPAALRNKRNKEN